jgi:hypothetical protein
MSKSIMVRVTAEDGYDDADPEIILDDFLAVPLGFKVELVSPEEEQTKVTK